MCTAYWIREIWAFDSFQGYPVGSRNDEAEDSMTKEGHRRTVHDDSSVDVVKSRLAANGFKHQLDERFILIPGYFPGTFDQYSGKPISFLHLDCDLYGSYKACLEFFWRYLKVGGVVALDEYASRRWPGCKRAVDEFLRESDISASMHVDRKGGRKITTKRQEKYFLIKRADTIS